MQVMGNRSDHVGLGGHRSIARVWAELRKHYPEKMDPSKFEGEVSKDDECPSKFFSFQSLKKVKEESCRTPTKPQKACLR